MLNIARVARERGYEAYTASKWVKTAVDRKRNDPWHYYIGSRLENTVHRYFSWMTDFQDTASCWATRRLIRRIERVQPDLVHLHDVVGWYLNIDVLFRYLKKKGIPVIWTFHDCWAFTGRCIYFDAAGCDRWKTGCGNCPQLNYMPRTWWFDRSAWNFRRKRNLFTALEGLTIVTPSQWLKDLTEQSFFAGRDIRVINNGIDLNVFHPCKEGEYYRRLSEEGKKIVLGVAGTWSVRKGLDALVKLSRELPEDRYRVVVVGAEAVPDAPEILCIPCTHNAGELAQIYSAADVLVNPTLEDNFPTVNLEALACGTPVVTYRTGGSPESVTPQTGIVVAKGDYDALKAAVLSVCEKGREAWAPACLSAAKNYDMNACFNDYVDLYEEILKQ